MKIIYKDFKIQLKDLFHLNQNELKWSQILHKNH